MKITDKIVTSITLPQQTNVLWHNPETGELKMFGNTGWEVVGGGESPELPKIVESGWVLDKETGGIATNVVVEKPNTCSYQDIGPYAWVFDGDPGLVTDETYELTEVGTDNKVSVVCLGNPSGPWGVSGAYAFEGDLDTSKVYSYGTYEINISNTASGLRSIASGDECTASGNNSYAEGHETTASGEASHAEGSETKARGNSSHAEGGRTTAGGHDSHAEGWNTTASGDSSHAEGYGTTASNDRSHAEGYQTTASGETSHAEGSFTTASGKDSHAEGSSTTASSKDSHAEGYCTTASGIASHSEGQETTASGDYSHAEGGYTTAASPYQHVQGKYNMYDYDEVYQFIIGNGNDEDNRSNALAIKWDGTIVLWKDIDTPLELTPAKLEALLALV